MPHDRNGVEIKVEDVVFIPCVVQSVYTSETGCNVSLKTQIPMPGNEQHSFFSLNTKQVEKAGSL